MRVFVLCFADTAEEGLEESSGGAETMSRRGGHGRGDGRNESMDLKLNLGPPTAGGGDGRSSSSSSSSSSPSSCLSSETTEQAAARMVLAACPRCLMYVMLAEEDSKCPKCKNGVLLDFLGANVAGDKTTGKT